jgi:adenylosuccinate synthase
MLFEQLEPIYETLPGWEKPTHGVRSYGRLDENAKAYLRFIEDFTGCRVCIISTSADRDDTIVLS